MRQNKVKLTKLSFILVFILVSIFNYIINYRFTNISFLNARSKNCKCLNSTYDNLNKISIKSTCNDKASLRGPGQKVISYSLYFSKDFGNNVFFGGIKDNLKDMRKNYPGWLMRIYTDIEVNDKICYLLCENEDLFWCNVHNIPSYETDLEDVQGMIWRTFPLGDELVDKFLIRDLDSPLTLREVAAVKDWESSAYPFHVMRDHPYHTATVLGCCWAIDNVKLGRKRAKMYFHKFINKGWRRGKPHVRDVDQYMFHEILYRYHPKEWLAHDSFHCERYGKDGGEIRPFPTQRLAGPKFEFVGDCMRKGCNFSKMQIGKCPLSCRPIGKQWEYC